MKQVSELPRPSRRERRVMDIPYESGGATAVQIRERMADPPTFFGDSVEGAVATLLKLSEDNPTPAQRERIKAMIDETPEEGR